MTEEMLATWEREAESELRDGGGLGVADDVLALIAEVRRLRAITCPTCEQASDAAGYARAERDVVAWLGDDGHVSDCVCTRCALMRQIEQGAHRGAAKEGT